MTDAQATSKKVDGHLQHLPGYISVEKKESGSYATYYKNTYAKGRKILHDSDYLGKVINLEQGLFFSRVRGYFTFNLTDGYGVPDRLITPEISQLSKIKVLRFGDIWMVDQIMKQTGLNEVLDNLVPSAADTVKSLVAFRLIDSSGYDRAEEWYRTSYARILYPEAIVTSSMTSKYHAMLGKEETYQNFFASYLSIITKDKDISNKISFPILIDSTGLPNDIDSYLTAVNNHNGVISNEIRLIYVVDKVTKLPIFFRYIPGNIIDNSTLIATINLLSMYNINIDVVIMDAGYSSLDNINKLLSSGISFITRMTKNKKEYKELLDKYGQDLECGKNAISYGDRSLYGKKVPITLCDKNLFAYIMLDSQQKVEEEKYIFNKYKEDSDKASKIDEKLKSIGRFIILSSKDYEIDEILPIYYTRQIIEQVFDVSKNFADLLPLRAHSYETIRGRLLLSFIATILYILINQKLANSKFCASKAIYYLRNLNIKISETANLIDELTKIQKDILSVLQLESPYSLERGNLLQQKPFISNLKSSNRKRGRPKGSKNKKRVDYKKDIHSDDNGLKNMKKRGRPKGSKNRKIIQAHDAFTPDTSTPSIYRGRGRPKGSRNKVKTLVRNTLNSSDFSVIIKGRGRPKGRKNRIKPT
jgi:hypothetical protein